jgi:hypothetical protein
MLVSLAIVWNLAQWVQDEYTIWHGPGYTTVATVALDSHVTSFDLRERIRQYQRVHPDSKTYAGTKTEVCMRLNIGKFTLRGFTDNHWVMVETKSTDWRTALNNCPVPGLTHGFPTLSPFGESKSGHSQLPITHGSNIALSSRWYWLDEELGVAPTIRPYTLVDSLTHTAVRVKHLTAVNRKRSLSYLGFTQHLLD